MYDQSRDPKNAESQDAQWESVSGPARNSWPRNLDVVASLLKSAQTSPSLICNALNEMPLSTMPLVQAVIRDLEHDRAPVRQSAELVLCEMGSGVLRWVRPLLNNPRPEVREAANSIIALNGSLGGRTFDTILREPPRNIPHVGSVLTKLEAATDPQERTGCHEILKFKLAAAVDSMATHLDSPHYEVRQNAVLPLALIGSAVVPAALNHLDAGSPQARRAAAEVLYHLGRSGRLENRGEAETALALNLSHEDWDLRGHCARVLGTLTKLSEFSLKALKECAETPDSFASMLAKFALQKNSVGLS